MDEIYTFEHERVFTTEQELS